MSRLVSPADKVVDRAELVARWGRPRQGRLVFTNGCFDLLHRGHAEYLYQARDLGDALVVGVNADASVRELKGRGRPLIAGRDRAFLVAALGYVDAVTLFEEDTPQALIRALLPDVLVKGGDYQPDEVVGRAEVEAAGGRLVLLPLVEGHSTSGLAERIRASS